ncbi:YqcI/YcgG family protein [Paenibacillus lentus]|uniref:YqcI/YcgG family protein n=1 Tax=Paenibacillus lentus TaxID=1338368 RepID=A0A3Q8SE85_9BACL|nr:YqcI/YcgG family protein [Paenibacillus lentus]AZK48760.1 YqcI/YcgG family protein [Paenibacillus lentus]
MLYDQVRMKELLLEEKGWKYEAYRQFAMKLSDPSYLFPCIPATIGFKQGHFRYGFIGDPRGDQAATEMATLLKRFGEQARSYGRYTSLVLFCETSKELTDSCSVEEYREIFWTLLRKVRALDNHDWPAHIPTDPHDPVWEYCFGQEQYFMYCATPAHRLRQSRHFPYFIMAITPRWVLVDFNSSSEAANRMKHRIRERILQYDAVGIHPDLNSYGSEDNLEWKQYFLRDDTAPSGDRCPFSDIHLKKS